MRRHLTRPSPSAAGETPPPLRHSFPPPPLPQPHTPHHTHATNTLRSQPLGTFPTPSATGPAKHTTKPNYLLKNRRANSGKRGAPTHPPHPCPSAAAQTPPSPACPAPAPHPAAAAPLPRGPLRAAAPAEAAAQGMQGGWVGQHKEGRVGRDSSSSSEPPQQHKESMVGRGMPAVAARGGPGSMRQQHEAAAPQAVSPHATSVTQPRSPAGDHIPTRQATQPILSLCLPSYPSRRSCWPRSQCRCHLCCGHCRC